MGADGLCKGDEEKRSMKSGGHSVGPLGKAGVLTAPSPRQEKTEVLVFSRTDSTQVLPALSSREDSGFPLWL